MCEHIWAMPQRYCVMLFRLVMRCVVCSHYSDNTLLCACDSRRLLIFEGRSQGGWQGVFFSKYECHVTIYISPST